MTTNKLEFKAPDKVFGKYDANIEVKDVGLKGYITVSPMLIPHSFGRHAKKQFYKSKINIVERLINCLMRGGTGDKIGGRVIRTHGSLQGKKSRVTKKVLAALALIEKQTNSNPIQALVSAIENSAPREDFTRVSFGGVTYQVAVDVSPQRRVDLAIRNMIHATIMKAFNSPVTLEQALASEIAAAAKGDNINSYSVKKKNETERMAKSAR